MIKEVENLVVFGVASMICLGAFKTYGLIKKREGYNLGCATALRTTAEYLSKEQWTSEELMKELMEKKPTF